MYFGEVLKGGEGGLTRNSAAEYVLRALDSGYSVHYLLQFFKSCNVNNSVNDIMFIDYETNKLICVLQYRLTDIVINA